VPGDQHDLRIDLPLAETGERRQPVHAGQPHVEHDEIHGAARDPIETVLSGRDGFDGVPFVTQHARQRGPDARFVVDDEDGWIHRLSAPGSRLWARAGLKGSHARLPRMGPKPKARSLKPAFNTVTRL
jgi:hypothetical protein